MIINASLWLQLPVLGIFLFENDQMTAQSCVLVEELIRRILVSLCKSCSGIYLQSLPIILLVPDHSIQTEKSNESLEGGKRCMRETTTKMISVITIQCINYQHNNLSKKPK